MNVLVHFKSKLDICILLPIIDNIRVNKLQIRKNRTEDLKDFSYLRNNK